MKAILSSAFVQMKQSIARPMFRFCIFINPILSAFLIGMIYQNKSINDFTLYAFIGSGIMTFWTSICFSSASDMDREKWIGTLPILFVSPIGFTKIILGKILGNTVWGILSFSLNMLTVFFIFNKQPSFLHFDYFIIITILMILSMIAVALLLCGLFTLSRQIRLLMNFMDMLFTILTGLLFPVDILPKFIQFISYSLAPTWAMKGFKLAINGGSNQEMINVLLILLGVTCLYFVISSYVFKKILKLCMINGSLEVF